MVYCLLSLLLYLSAIFFGSLDLFFSSRECNTNSMHANITIESESCIYFSEINMYHL